MLDIRKKMYSVIINRASNKKRARYLRKWYGIDIGEGCEIYADVNWGSEPYLIKIGNNVRITSGVIFCNHDGGIWVIRNLGINKNADLFGKINIGDNVHIGINSIIMPGINIGSNVIIGAGSVVTRDVPDNSVAAGIPARVIKTIDEYYEKNKNKILDTKNMTYQDKVKMIKEKIR